MTSNISTTGHPGQPRSLPDLAQHVQAAVAVVDRQGVLVDFNAHYCRLHGYDRHELLGRHFTAVSPKRLHAPLQRLHETFFLTGQERPSYWQLCHKDGREIYVKSQSVLCHGEGAQPFRVTTTIDMTDHRREEREMQHATDCVRAAICQMRSGHQSLLQAQKMASLDDLICGVAHELNTPIGITLTSSSHLLEKVCGLRQEMTEGTLSRRTFEAFLETAEQTLGLVLSSTQRASTLVQGFRQISTDREHEEPRLLALRPHMMACLHALAPDLAARQADVRIEVPTDLSFTTRPRALSQVIVALLDNALRHGFADGRAGRVMLWARQAGDRVSITIRDNGMGIPPDDLPRIFDPFFNGSGAGACRGLGLTMAYNVISHALGGSISVESVINHHSAFRILLPLAPLAERRSRRHAAVH